MATKGLREMAQKVTHDLIQHKQYRTNDTEWVVQSRCYPYMTCSPIGSSSAKWTAINGRCECNSTAFPPRAIKTGHWTDFQLTVNCMPHCLYNSASSSTLHVRQNMPLAWAKTKTLNKFSVLWARCSSDILHCWPFILIRYLLLHNVTPGTLVEKWRPQGYHFGFHDAYGVHCNKCCNRRKAQFVTALCVLWIITYTVLIEMPLRCQRSGMWRSLLMPDEDSAHHKNTLLHSEKYMHLRCVTARNLKLVKMGLSQNKRPQIALLRGCMYLLVQLGCILLSAEQHLNHCSPKLVSMIATANCQRVTPMLQEWGQPAINTWLLGWESHKRRGNAILSKLAKCRTKID